MGLWLGILTAIVALAAGCSSPATNDSTTTTVGGKAPPLATTTTSTSTTVPPTTVPTVQSTSVQVQITGSTATVDFPSSSVSGSLSPQPGSFSQGGTVYTFEVSGVQYSGSPSTTTATGGLITSVVVSSGSGGPTIAVTLSSPQAHATYGLGHDEVGVSFS
jgi:hypothetical protein